MPMNRRKSAALRRWRSVKGRTKLKTCTETNNNCLNETGNEPSVSSMEIDLISKIIEPKNEAITKCTSGASTELPIDTTEVNIHSASNASNAFSCSSFLEGIDLKIAKLKRKRNPTCKPRSRPLKTKIVKSEPMEIDNNPGCDNTADVPSASQPQADLISKIEKPARAKYTGKRRGRLPKKLIKSKEFVLVEDDFTSESEDTFSNSQLEIGSDIPDRVKPIENLPCELESTTQNKPIQPEPMTIEDSPESKHNDIPLAPEVQTDLISKMKKPRGRKPRVKSPKKLIKEIMLEDGFINKNRHTSSNSQLEIGRIPDKVKPIEKFACEPESTTQKIPIQPESMAIENSPESKHNDIPLTPEVQTDLISKMKKPRGRKPRAKTPKELIKEIVLEDGFTSKDRHTFSNSQLEIGRIPDKVKPIEKLECEPESTTQKTSVQPKSTAIENNPESKHNDIPLTPEVQTDLISKIKRPRGRTPRAKTPKELIKEIVLEDGFTSKDRHTSSNSQLEIGRIPDKVKPIEKLECEPESTTQKTPVQPKSTAIENNPESKHNDIPLTPEVQTDLISKIKRPRRRTPRAKTPKELIKEIVLEDGFTSKDRHTSSNSQLEIGRIPDKVKPIEKLACEPESTTQKTSVQPKSTAIENNPESKHNDIPLTPEVQIDLISKIKRPRGRTPRAKTPKKLIKEIVLEDGFTSKNRDISSILNDKKYQPKVLVFNIAYSNILSPKQREMLSKNNQSKLMNLSPKIVPDSSTNQSMERSMPHDIIGASSELVKGNNEPIEDVSSIRASNDSNSKKHRVRKTGTGRTRQPKVSTPNSWDKIYAPKLSVQKPETIRGSLTITQHNKFGKKLTKAIVPHEEEIPILPSPDMVEVEETPLDLSIRIPDTSISSNYQSNVSKPNDDSIIEIYSVSKKHRSQDTNVHDVGIGSSIFCVTDLSNSCTEIDDVLIPMVPICGNSTLEECECQDGNSMSHIASQLPEISTATKRVRKKASAKSTNKEATAKSTTKQATAKSTNKQATAKPTSKQATAKSTNKQATPKPTSKQATAKSTNKQATAKPTNKQAMVKSTNNQATTKSTKKQATTKSTKKQATAKSTGNQATTKSTKKQVTIKSTNKQATAESKPESPSVNSFSLKVSIPAKHYFNKRSVAREEVQTKSAHIELNEIDNQSSKDVADSISDQKPRQINSMTAESQTSTEGLKINSDQDVVLPARLPDMCTLDDIDVDCPETLRSTNVTASEPTMLVPDLKPTISNVRSLPKIVIDELLPKGTITLSSISCKSSMSHMITANMMNDGSYSMNINEMDEDQEIRQLTIHQQSTYTSIVNQNVLKSQKITHCWNQTQASADMDNINVGNDTVDDCHELKSLHSISSEQFQERIQSNNCYDQNSTSIEQQHFDSAQLWEICPELKSYFIHDDVLNNNNEDRSQNCDTLSTVNTNCNNNNVDTLSTGMEMETETNVVDCNNMDYPSSNNITHIAEDANNLQDAIEDEVAVTAVDHNEMEVESSESIVTNNDSNLTKSCVIGNLTTANLRNFNSSTHDGGSAGLMNWSAETCRYFLSHGDSARQSNDKSMAEFIIETSCDATGSTLGSQQEFPQAKSKMRSKRKWLEDSKNRNLLEPPREKRFKLNRNNHWSTDGQNSKHVNNFSMPTLVESANSDNNSMTSNFVEKSQSPKKNSCEKKLCTTAKKTFGNEPDVAAEKITEVSMSIKYDCEPEEQNLRVSTPLPVCTSLDSRTSKCGFGNDSCLLVDLCISPPRNFENNDTNSKVVDENGNVTSSSSSSSSSSQSSTSSSNCGKSTHSNNSDRYNPATNDPDNKSEKEEDCISLFAAESMIENLEQGSANMTEATSLSPLYDPPKKSNEKFQDMVDVGAYFDKNVQECNEAYESCMQEDKNVHNQHNTLYITPDTSTIENHDRQIIPQLDLSLSTQHFGHEPCPSATIQQKSSPSNIANLKDRLGLKISPTPNTSISAYVRGIFHGHCFSKLRRGICYGKACHYRHHLTPNLLTLEERDPDLINEIIDHAIWSHYNYFIEHMYPKIIMRMDYPNIIKLFYKLCRDNDLMKEYLVEHTIAAVTKIGISLREFLTDISLLLNDSNNYDPLALQCILRAANDTIEPGFYWHTCRDLLIKIKPSNPSTHRIIRECIHNKDKLQIEDVYINYIKKLTAGQISKISTYLRRQFDLLLVQNDLINKIDYSSQLSLFENSKPAGRMLKTNVTENDCKDRIEIPTILSPDDAAHYNYDNYLSRFSPGNKQNQKFSSQELNSDMQLFTQNQNTGINSTPSSHNAFNQRRGASTQVNSILNQHSTDSNIKTPDFGAVDSFTNPFKLHQIDNLEPPCSQFRERHWKFHLDMTNLKEALKHEEYSLALEVLNKYADADQTIFISSCYKMLRKNVMASAHHVRNMMNLSVRMRVNKFLNQTLFNLGMYMMIELCNINAWVLAYSLFKSLMQYPPSLVENNATFPLISAEICLANRRPLKAFIILKQNNMFCTDRSKWHVTSNPNDELVRVWIINLLLDILCQEYPDRALYIFTYLIKDQTRIYYPIDLTAYIDKLVTGILSGRFNELITDVGRLIIENNFTLKNSVFQSLVVNIFQNDIALCRQLYRYGTWLGVYSIVKLTLPLHILIKTNWTKEEMYLVVIDFLEELSMEIGPAVDRIGPNQFAIHLVFELAPFKQRDNVQICNIDELKMSKELMKTVLQEKFNPPIRTIIAEKERFMKLQSRSVVNYLKSMNAQQ